MNATAAAKPLRAVDRIRASARELFYRVGIRAVGVDQIVARAGVTKPSLYRSFASKDELAAAYLRDYDVDFFARFDETVAAHPGDPRAQVLAYLTRLSGRATQDGYRGCGLTNAMVEYPDVENPARQVAQASKHRLRERLRAMAAEMGASDPEALGDGLLLLFEGTYSSGQCFGEGGPARHLATVADWMISAALAKG